MTGEAPRIEGARVRLRPPREADAPLIEPLRAEAGRPGGEGDTLVITRTGEDLPIGVLEYRIDDPADGSATIAWIALAEEVRRWGLGVDAVLLFEEDAVRRRGVRQFRAYVDARHGLALYFWLRLGYHPLGPELDEQGHSVMRMAREVS
jgi:RimJ/RimL family protein N-acetyltransferase